MIITIDGPGAAGKGTLARRLSKEFGWPCLDTGALYRSFALYLLSSNGNPEDAKEIKETAETITVKDLEKLFTDPRLMDMKTSETARICAGNPAVRKTLLSIQQDFIKNAKEGAIVEGRDIGTVVCPQADVKFFVTASPASRAERQFKDRKGKDGRETLDVVLEAVKKADEDDKNRKISPLVPAMDAVIIDTTSLSAEEVYKKARVHIDLKRKSEIVTLTIGGKTYELPVLEATTGEKSIDITNLMATTGYTAFDPGFGNTASCDSKITYVNGTKGILSYRGVPIEKVAENMTFIETALLLIFGKQPSTSEMAKFSHYLTQEELLHEGLLYHFDSFPSQGEPMAFLSAMINSIGNYSPHLLELETLKDIRRAAAQIISKIRTISAFAYRKINGLPTIYPNPDFKYCHNFLHMMFSLPYKDYVPTDEELDALNKFLILHADHEQNCSTSVVRIVGSAQTNLFASVASGVCALWGKLHGGANLAVIESLEILERGDETVDTLIEKVKRKETRLMGFGHRVYKTFDPRAKILKAALEKLLETNKRSSRLMDFALELERKALADDYFKERNLYPNVDFYSGMILRTLRIPNNMFPVMFAMGRAPGWIANWYEDFKNGAKLSRPRQVYTGLTDSTIIPLEDRF